MEEKPLNEKEIVELVKNFETIITVEEGVINGGFGSVINQIILANDLKNKVINLGVPDVFIEHATVNEQLKQCGLDAESMQNLFKEIQNV